MDINTLNTIRDFINATSLALLMVVFGIALIGAFRPKALAFVLKEFAGRRYILAGGVFIGMLCGTIYTATQPDYGSFEASQQKPHVQSQALISQSLQTQKAPGSEVQGATTEQPRPKPTSPTPPSPPQSRPQPQPSPSPQEIVEAPSIAIDTSEVQHRRAENRAKPKECDGAQILFVCL